MQTNFIDALPSGPAWVPWLVLAVFVVASIAGPALYLRTKQRMFWLDLGSAYGILFGREIDAEDGSLCVPVLQAWGRHIGTTTIVVYAVDEQRSSRGAALLTEAQQGRPGRTVVGTTSVRLRYEYGSAWVTKLLGGVGPVYEIAVVSQPGDPEGARALAHELGWHVWSHVHGSGWDRAHDRPVGELMTEGLLWVLRKVAP